jgi:hypothetical protein
MSHPVTNDPMRWQQDIPMDIRILIDLLVRDLGLMANIAMKLPRD